MTILSFIVCMALVAGLTWLMTRKGDNKTSEGYFLAGRSLGAVTIAGSLLLTNLSTEQIIGLNGFAFTDGLSVMAWEVVSGITLVLLALYFLPRYLASGIATVPELLEERFGKTTRIITTIIFIVAYGLILLPIVLFTGARGLTDMLDVASITGIASDTANIWLMVWLIGLVGAVYAIFGGLRSIAVSDTLNGALLLVGGLMITGFGLAAVAKGSGEGSGMIKGAQILYEQNPDKFNSLGTSEQSVPWHTLFTGVFLLPLFYWTTNQQIIQRTFGARNLAEGQKGVLLAAALKILAPLIVVIPGIIAFHLYAGDAELKGDMAYGRLVRDVLPIYLTGFFAAAIAGAILSSFNSGLNAVATLFSLGIYKGIFKPDADSKTTVRAGMICGTVVAILAMSTAPLLVSYKSIFLYLQEMNAIYFIPLLAVVLGGMINKRASEKAALITLAFSLTAMLLGSFVIKEWITSTETGLGVNFFHYVGLVFALSIGVFYFTGWIFPREVPYVQVDSGKVEMTRWKLAYPVSAVLVIVVLGIYIMLAL